MLNRIAAFAAALALAVSAPATAEAKPANKSRRAASAGSVKKIDSATTKAETAKGQVAKSDSSSTIAEEIRRADAKPSGAASPSADKTLVVTVDGMMAERGNTVVLFGEGSNSLKDYLDLFRKAREDKNVKTVVVRFTSVDMGMATAQELRQGIEELNARGKKTLAFVETDSQVAYLAASACRELVMPPSGDIGLHGVKADMYYLKNLLEKVGVTAEIVHMGQYKSYGETFTNDQPTTPARENMTEIVDDTYAQLIDTIAASRKLPREEVEAIVNRGPAGAEEARASKLVDRVAYADEVLAELKKGGAEIVLASDYKDSGRSSSSSSDLSFMSLLSMMNSKQSSGKSSSDSKYPQVAVLYAVGPIEMGGSDDMGFGSEEVIASEDFIETLEEIRADKKIKGVILRVNSPGGSAFASDLIWKKIEELKKEKPVIASMGDVAASGGYYIAMGANKIIAQEGTITGSIGVVGGKPNLSGLYQKLGVNKETISRGEYAGLYSETSSFTPKERQSIERMMQRTYDEFVSKAAEGRRMPKDRLYEVAQGKVWSGARAKTVGLVDELGGMGKAIAETKKALGMKSEDKVALVAYPKELGLMDVLQKAMGGSSTSARVSAAAALLVPRGIDASSPVGMMWSSLPRGLRSALMNAASVGRMLQREQVLAVMPTVPQVQ